MADRTSIFWQPSIDEFKNLILKSRTLKEVIQKFDLIPSAGHYKTLNKRIKEDNSGLHTHDGVQTEIR